VRVRVVKNKVAPPFKVAEFDIMYDEGISKVGDILDLSVEMELIEKRGSYYSYGETRLGQGRENARSYLKDYPELAYELETALRNLAGLHGGADDLSAEGSQEEREMEELFEPAIESETD
jgi:recombination protein RecA